MIFGSVCSGIEAASVAWKPLGWRAAFVSEVDPFPSAVLAHHHPESPNLGDFTTIGEPPEPVRLLVGGTPCQDFSVAGLRRGLDGDRGNLTLEFLRLAGRLRPDWLVWENVPGVLSIDGGRAFGAFLGGLVELGYGFAYRVLDAQHFGVPQRRRRVFVVGHLGDWRRAVAVLFERDCLSGNPPPRREAGPVTPRDIAPCLRANGVGTERIGDTRGQDCLIAVNPGSSLAFGGNNTAGSIDVATALTAHGGTHGRLDFESETFVAHTLRGEGFDASEDGTGRGTLIHQPIPIDMRQASRGGTMTNNRPEGSSGGAPGTGIGEPGDPSPSLSLSHPPAIASARSAVRRLTPVECERLQGFPDDYTLVPYRGKPADDGNRYKALGNSMAVPVMAWIGRRISEVDP